MPSDDDKAAVDLLRRCLEEKVSSADYDRAEALLDRDPDLAYKLRQELGFEALLRTALREEDAAAFAQRIGSRIRDRGNSRQFARAMRRRVDSARRSRRRLSIWPALAAALVLISVLGFLFIARPPGLPAAASVQGIIGELAIHRGGSQLSVDEGATLAIGDTITSSVESSAHILFSDGMEVVLDGPGRLTLADSSKLNLEQGKAHFVVPKRTTGEPLRVSTPQTAIAVLGTRFAVAVDQSTGITVESGRLQVVDRANGALRVLEAGSSLSFPLGSQALFTEHWDQGLGNWLAADATLQPSGEDALLAGYTLEDGELRIPAGEAPHLLSPIDWPLEAGRHLITTRFQFEPSGQSMHPHIPLAIVLRGPSERFPEPKEVPKPSIVAGHWYHLALTVDPQRQADGGWILQTHVVVAEEGNAAAEPFVVSKKMWRLDEASPQNALLFMLRGNIEALKLGPLSVLRLNDDSL